MDVFVSLNPHTLPDLARTHHKLSMAHSQFRQDTCHARQAVVVA